MRTVLVMFADLGEEIVDRALGTRSVQILGSAQATGIRSACWNRITGSFDAFSHE
jgi:hypothetical protein